MAGVVDGFQAGQPGFPLRLPGAFPEPLVADAQTFADAAEPAAGHHADGQLLAPQALRGRGRGESVQVRAALCDPGVVVALAQASGARLSDTAGHPRTAPRRT